MYYGNRVSGILITGFVLMIIGTLYDVFSDHSKSKNQTVWCEYLSIVPTSIGCETVWNDRFEYVYIFWCFRWMSVLVFDGDEPEELNGRHQKSWIRYHQRSQNAGNINRHRGTQSSSGYGNTDSQPGVLGTRTKKNIIL